MRKLFFNLAVAILLVTLSGMSRPVVAEKDEPGMPFLEYFMKRAIFYQTNEEIEAATGRHFNFMERLALSVQRRKMGKAFKKSGHLQDCDSILLKNGKEIKAVIIEIGAKNIRYKKCDDRTGPVLSMDKQGVSMIRYANGTKDVLDDQSNQGTYGSVGPGPAKTESLAIVAIISGIASLILLFTGLGGFYMGIAGIVLGFIAKKKIKKSRGSLKGKGLANAGIITGFITLGLTIAIIVVILVAFL